MSFLDAIIEGFVNAVLPGVVCPIIRKCAGPHCEDLKLAIMMNDSLLDAYKKGAESAGLWSYDRVKSTARSYPNAKEMVSTEKVVHWLKDQGDHDIVTVLMNTPGGMRWLSRQVEDFKNDLFG